MLVVLLSVALLTSTAMGFRDARIRGEAMVSHVVLEKVAQKFLKEQEQLFSLQCTRTMNASWNFQTNVTAHNKAILMAEQKDFRKLQKESWKLIERWRDLAPFLRNSTIKRHLETMTDLGPTALPAQDLAKYKSILRQMTALYTTKTICSYGERDDCSLTMKKGVKEVLRSSRDPEELLHVWKEWRDGTKSSRSWYSRFVEMANVAARANSFLYKEELELFSYGGGDFKDQLTEAWEQLRPLYLQLHAYTRRKLREVYGAHVVSKRGPLPAHLLGDMWAQVWKIKDLLAPFPGKTFPSATEEMKRQGYTPWTIFQKADDFFASLNLTRAPSSFWRDSLLEQPRGRDRKVICYASAWDFCNKRDFRVKHCSLVREEDLVSAHHEMTHLQYFLQYRHLPYHYREGANPGFHEALAYAIGLSVATPRHLQRLGLLNWLQEDSEADISFLLGVALEQVAFMPFAYLMDLWRWRVFDGTYEEKDWNCAWWDLRVMVQGIKPPVLRSEEDFDPAAKYHVVADLPYTSNFVAFVLQFQFHKALCLKAGEYDPLEPAKALHKCDIYQSNEAGNALRKIMRLGRSRPWPEALESLTGSKKMDASVMREYFKPLEEWLTKDNERHKEFVGWRADNEYCVYRTGQPAPHPSLNWAPMHNR